MCNHQQYIYRTIFWAAVLSGGVLGCDPEIVTFWSFGHNLLPPVKGFVAGGEEAEMKSQYWGSCTWWSWEQGLVWRGFPPRERGDREFFAGVQAVNAIYLKMQVFSLASTCLGKVRWRPHVTNLRFLRAFAGWPSPSFLKDLLCSLVFACQSPETQS